MSGDQFNQDDGSTDRLGVIIGSCGYSHRLYAELNQRVERSRFYSWTRRREFREDIDFINPFNLAEALAILRQDGITHVLSAGQVHVEPLKFDVVDYYSHSPEERHVAEAKLTSPRQILRDYAQGLNAHGITAVSVRDFMPGFDALEGHMGKQFAEARFFRCLPELKKQTRDLFEDLLDEPIVHAVLFDLKTDLTYRPTLGKSSSDELLRKALPKPDHTYRILLKVKPHDLPACIDDPTIGPQTIDNAIKAQVDMIALDWRNGVVIDRDLTVQLADDAGIAIIGI